MLDKETLIRAAVTFILCFAILIGWQMLAPRFSPPPAPVTAQTQNNSTDINPEINIVPGSTVVAPSESATVLEEPVVIKTESYKIAFDSQTGDIRYVDLHSYSKLGESPVFISSTGVPYASFTAGIKTGFTHEITETANGTIITFTAQNDQVIVKKSYTVGTGYHIPMSLEVTNLTGGNISVPVTAKVGPGLGEGFGDSAYVFEGPIIHKHRETEKKRDNKVSKTLSLDAPLWGGYTSKYFLFSIFAQGFNSAQIVKDNNSADVVFTGEISAGPGQTTQVKDLAIFVGPKDYNDLKSYGIELQKSIDFGVFFFLAIPMTKVLHWAYGFVHNYGLAIIILTIIVKIITLPLTLKSTLSMMKMSKLQPEMAALREKFKDDPQKMNAATMELYKKHNVNPLAGCLPMIIQLPIFFALYKSLLVSIQLKGAPFFGWITDLSEKDPYYITPIIMGVTMFIQQKMTPTTADPMQQRIFLIMPVIFTFLFLQFPSGLVIYWLTNNVLSIIQQYVINTKAKKNDPAVIAPVVSEAPKNNKMKKGGDKK